jgi:hypothetical protein
MKRAGGGSIAEVGRYIAFLVIVAGVLLYSLFQNARRER